MTRKLSHLLLTVAATLSASALLLSSGTARSQSLVPSKTWSAPVRNPSEVHDLYSGGVDVVAFWLNLWGEQSVNARITSLVEQTAQQQRELIEWTANGVLLEVTVIRQGNPNTPLTQIALLNDKVTVVGNARTPEAAFFKSWSRKEYRAGIPDGWSFDPIASAFIWVTKSPNGTMVKKSIPRGTVLDLEDSVRASWDTYALADFRSNVTTLDVWTNVVTTAKARIESAAARRALDRAFANVKDSQKRVADIQKRFYDAVEREKEGQQALTILRTLQGIVSVAALAEEAASLLGENPVIFSSATTHDEILNTATTTVNGRTETRVQLLSVFDGSLADFQKYLDLLWVGVLTAKPPTDVRENFVVKKP